MYVVNFSFCAYFFTWTINCACTRNINRICLHLEQILLERNERLCLYVYGLRLFYEANLLLFFFCVLSWSVRKSEGPDTLTGAITLLTEQRYCECWLFYFISDITGDSYVRYNCWQLYFYLWRVSAFRFYFSSTPTLRVGTLSL